MTSFDRFGNYTIGLTDHTVFPEIDIAKAAPAHGMEITFTTDAKTKEKGMVEVKKRNEREASFIAGSKIAEYINAL